VTVKILSTEIAEWWDSEVQPTIDRDPSRADAAWSWPLFTAVNGWRPPPKPLPRGFAVCLEITRPGGEGASQPVALVQMVTRCPFIEEPWQGCVLVCYLSTIPRSLLAPEHWVGLVGRAGMDVAVVTALESGHSGRVMLTVGTKDSARLVAWYELRCRMSRITALGHATDLCFVHRPATALASYHDLACFRATGASDA